MGAESLEAETRGFNFLHKLAFSHRNDAEEISYLNKPPEDAPPIIQKLPQTKTRGLSFLQADLKTRKKETLTSVFALSEIEFKKIE